MNNQNLLNPLLLLNFNRTFIEDQLKAAGMSSYLVKLNKNELANEPALEKQNVVGFIRVNTGPRVNPSLAFSMLNRARGFETVHAEILFYFNDVDQLVHVRTVSLGLPVTEATGEELHRTADEITDGRFSKLLNPLDPPKDGAL